MLPDADVQLFADGTLIGQGTVSSTGTTVKIITNGSFTLDDGLHAITATQTLENQAVNVGNLSTTTNLASTASTALDVTVDTVAPQFSSTPVTAAQVEVPYSYQAVAAGSSGIAVTYQLTQNPTGMTVGSTTGLISWTPTAAQTPTEAVTLVATDAAGNTAQQAFTIDVAAHACAGADRGQPLAGNDARQRAIDRPLDELHQQRRGHENR